MVRTSHASRNTARTAPLFRTRSRLSVLFISTLTILTAVTITALPITFARVVLRHSSDGGSRAFSFRPHSVLPLFSSPGSLGNYATTGLSGATVFMAPSDVAANVTFSNLTRGAGITATSVTNAFNSSGWTTSSGPDPNDYYEFSITPAVGYNFSTAELRVGLQRSSTGPANVVLRSSVDGFVSNISSVIAPPAAPALTATSIIDLSSVAGLQTSSVPVTLRLYGYGASSSAGTLRIERVTSVPMVGLEVDGSSAPSCSPVVITSNPSNTTVTYGDDAVFTSAAEGTPVPTVIWEQSSDGGATWSSTGETTATLVVNSPPVTMSGTRYRAVFTNECGGATVAMSDEAMLTVDRRAATWITNDNSRYFGQTEPDPLTNGSPLGFLPGDGVSATYARDPGSGAGTYHITANLDAAVPGALDNYDVTNAGGTFSILADPTSIYADENVDGVNNDCTNNTYTAVVKDSVTNTGLAGVSLRMTIGTQEATGVTDANGVATFVLTLSQPAGTVLQQFMLDGAWNDPDRLAPSPTAARDFEILGDPDIEPGNDADSLYTGSLFFWTSSATSSTATLTLSSTIRDASGECSVADITTARVSFYVSSNGGSSFSPVNNAQNLPVGLVDPNQTSIGTASAISQYNIGSSQSVTLIVRVVVGGHYDFSSSEYDIPITIGKPGTANSLMGGGKLKNDASPFPANGYFGINSVSSTFGAQVQYNKKGTNPQGQVTVYVRSCNFPSAAIDLACSPGDPSTHHVYFIKSNSISELALINGSASFGSKTTVSEVIADGTRVSLDGGSLMQLMFTPFGLSLPPNNTGNPIGPTCTYTGGCASIVLYRSSAIGGGVWYSSSWGALPNKPPQTWLEKILNGTVTVQ